MTASISYDRLNSTSDSTAGTTTNQFYRVGFKTAARARSGGGGCNESKAHSNEEKALYHGLKSAYRMSRTPTGGRSGEEYGTADPPYETAARIAADVAIAFFETTDHEYTRRESFEYLDENVVGPGWRPSAVLTNMEWGVGSVSARSLSDGLGRAWEQIDDKWHHYDAARTALAIAEGYLSEPLYGSLDRGPTVPPEPTADSATHPIRAAVDRGRSRAGPSMIHPFRRALVNGIERVSGERLFKGGGDD